MEHFFKIAQLALDGAEPGTQDEMKRVAETAMCLHYIRAMSPRLADTQKADIAALQDRLMAALHADAFLRLTVNPFLLQQAVTPYIFLRADGAQSPYYEALLETFFANDLAVREGYHFRALERSYLMWKAGKGPRPRDFAAPIMTDALQIYAFNRDLGYALTHTVLYSTDFGLESDADADVTGALLMLAAEALGRNDTDLCMEALLALTSQAPDASVVAAIVQVTARLQEDNLILFAARDGGADYHPIFVHQMLCARIQALTGRDVRQIRADTLLTDQIHALVPLISALALKDGAAIHAAYHAFCVDHAPVAFVDKVVSDRLDYLRSLAQRQVLFEREFSSVGRRDIRLYDEYLGQIAACHHAHPALGAPVARPARVVPGV
jgi:hypothetical protein